MCVLAAKHILMLNIWTDRINVTTDSHGKCVSNMLVMLRDTEIRSFGVFSLQMLVSNSNIGIIHLISTHVHKGRSCPGSTSDEAWKVVTLSDVFIYLFGRLSCANIDGSSSTHQIAYWNALSRPPRCQNLFKTLSLFCNGTTFPSHQTTAQRRSHNNNPSWDMESLVKYNALGHKRAASSIQSQGCFKLFHYHWQ